MFLAKWRHHPLLIFIFSLLALVSSLFLYIHWYLKASEDIERFFSTHAIKPAQVLEARTWVIVVTLSLLVTIISLGMWLIFTYYQKMIQLYRLQQNFINGFTHELKTPLASIQLFLDTFVQHDLAREDQLKFLGYMKKDATRLLKHVNRILGLGKLEDKKYSLQLRRSQLQSLVAEIVQRWEADNPELKIVIEPHAQNFEALVDRDLFAVIFDNILSNAQKYNCAEKKSVHISFEDLPKHVKILIKDNGIGLKKQDRRRIFRKFYQVGKTDNMSAKGSGLGLYFVEQVAKLHRAKVRATSDGPHLGATFCLCWPKLDSSNLGFSVSDER